MKLIIKKHIVVIVSFSFLILIFKKLYLRKIKREGYDHALFARDKACLNATFLLPADLCAIRSTRFALFTLLFALFSSLFLLLATTRARLAAFPPELFPPDLRLDFPPDLRLDFPPDLRLDLPLDLREPLLLEAILTPTSI